MRARYADQEGYVERGGVRIFYEVYGNGTPTVLFLPGWPIGHSRIWKAKVPCFARHYRVVVFDPRGNGKSDRPLDPAAYADTENVRDALAVMDAAGAERAILVGLSRGGWYAAMLAAEYPNRVLGAVVAGSWSPLGLTPPERSAYSFEDRLETEEGWAKFNRHYWLKDYRAFLEFFFSKIFPEPHSTKQIEDGVAWGLETTPDVLIATVRSRDLLDPLIANPEGAVALYRSIRCPMLIIHGDRDNLQSITRSVAIAEAGGSAHHGSRRGPRQLRA